jgi:hypothetical protein
MTSPVISSAGNLAGLNKDKQVAPRLSLTAGLSKAVA